MSRQYRLFFAQFPGGGTTRWETAYWAMRTYYSWRKDERISEVLCEFYNDTPITMTRNRAIRDAQAVKADYLLMIDSDICPDIHTAAAKPFWKTSWEFMMRRRERELTEGLMPATIGAPYCGPPPIENIYVFQWTSPETGDPDRKFQLEQFTRQEAARRVGIEEVAALPTGLILYDLRVFENLSPPWFEYEYKDRFNTHKCTTEDVYQTRNASLLGCPQYCNWDSWCSHIKTKHVVIPTSVCVEDIAFYMREALLKNWRRDEKIQFVGDPVDGPRPWAQERIEKTPNFGFYDGGDFYAYKENHGIPIAGPSSTIPMLAAAQKELENHG